jgi:hypothetical protein
MRAEVHMFFRLLFCALLGLLCGCSEYAVKGPAAVGLDTTQPVTEGPDAPAPPAEGSGSVHGRVCSPDGEGWVVGAFVWLDHSGGRAEAITDADGWFQLDGVAPGTWEVLVQKGSFQTTFEAEVREGEVTELPSDSCLEQGEIEIAVLTGAYDSIEVFLDRLGFAYDTFNGKRRADIEAFLGDPGLMASYDLIFFNCGIDSGFKSDATLTGNIEQFIRDGGSLYASDLAFQAAEAPFPAKIEFQGNDSTDFGPMVGASQVVAAQVVDPVMQQALGSSEAEVEFNLGGWAAMVSVSGADVLLEGRYDYNLGARQDGPLAVRFTVDGGTVIYTSFHNEPQINFDMETMLQEMILSL